MKLPLFCVCQNIVLVKFMDSSPLIGKIWYTLGTEREAMRHADAVEIFADNPTAFTCDTLLRRKEDK